MSNRRRLRNGACALTLGLFLAGIVPMAAQAGGFDSRASHGVGATTLSVGGSGLDITAATVGHTDGNRVTYCDYSGRITATTASGGSYLSNFGAVAGCRTLPVYSVSKQFSGLRGKAGTFVKGYTTHDGAMAPGTPPQVQIRA